jgi:hypothetical protein
MENISNMIKVSAAEFQRNIGRYQDMALTQPSSWPAAAASAR